jgi:hypothetical protein
MNRWKRGFSLQPGGFSVGANKRSKMKKIGLGLITFFLFLNSFAARQQVAILAKGESEVFQFARQELKQFLSVNYDLKEAGASWLIVLQTSDALAPGSFRVEYQLKGKTQQVNLSGSDEAAMVHAVYTFLEKCGMRFEISGPLFSEKLDLNLAKGYAETILPKVKQRGIRQHINFTMDISSYPLEEAKGYIQNLARLRFNFITFHSYPGEWYADLSNKKEPYAGNFFYGKRHDIPDEKLFHEKIRNTKTYCIPEIEPFFDDKPVREKMAVEWLQKVMNECKRVGLTVRFSFEPHEKSVDLQTSIETTKKILADYPMINELELITPETADAGNPLKELEIARLLTPLFGDEVLKDAIVMKPILTGSSGVARLFSNIGYNIRILTAIDSLLLKPKGIKGSLGLYVVNTKYLEACYHLLRKYAPDATYAVLPGHGSTRVARFLPYTDMEKKDWKKTMVYSWLEFDGLMYLQQNGISGIRSLIELAQDINGLDQVQSICFNHWRTAENKVTARYAAESTLLGAEDESSFYTSYAKAYEISNPDNFAKAMKQIDAAGWYATTELPNVGFCYALGSNAIGFGFLKNMKPVSLKQGREMYEKALEQIKSCDLSSNEKAGKDLLALFDNRLRATIVYLKAFEKGVEIQQFDEKNLTPDQRVKIGSVLSEAISGFEKYIQLYAEVMPDRGCEGTIISAYYVRIDALKKMRLNLCGIPY